MAILNTQNQDGSYTGTGTDASQAGANTASGNFTTPSGVSVNGATGAINSDALKQTPAINYQTPTPTPLFPVSSLPPVDPLTPTAPETKATDLSTRIQGIQDKLAGKAADTSKLYADQGYGVNADGTPNDPGLADLSTQLTQIQNEGKAIPQMVQQNAQGTDSTRYDINLTQTGALRENAIKALGVSSLIAAKQGKLAYASQLVNNAIQQKYGPLEAELAAKTANLKLIQDSPDYSLADKNRAAAQTQQINTQAAALAVEKQNALDAQTEALKYAPVADAVTLQQMQQAKSPAEVAQIAAAAGIQQPQAGRYKDVNATLKNLDGTTYQVTKVLDTLTGQYVGGGKNASQLNSGSTGGSAGVASGASRTGVPGTTGNAAIDTTSPGYTTATVGSTQLTQAAIDQKALSYLTSGTLPPQGRTGVAGIQAAAIANRMAEMDAGGNLAGHKADLKALSSSLTDQTKYLNTTQRAFNTANDTLTALQSFMTKYNINPNQFPDFNSFSNWLKSKGIDPGAASGYNAQITTLRQEYSQVLAKGGARSVETDNEAKALIPDNLAPADLARVAAQIKIDGENVTNDAQKQVSQIQEQINGIISPSPASTPSKLPQDVQDTVTKNVTFSPDGKTAYIPRSVWSTLGANMDAVLAEAKADGFTLLIK